MDNKEVYFGGLPEDLFNGILAFLQALVAGGGPAAAAALSALVSLAQSEHAAAASMVEVRPIDAIFKAIELKDDLAALNSASTGAMPTALAAFKAKLDKLTNFWLGK
jgi:hypothetical protein